MSHRRNKACIFCGNCPDANSAEHLLPRWIRKPGRLIDSSIRTITLTRNRSVEVDPDDLTLPSCIACNQRSNQLVDAPSARAFKSLRDHGRVNSDDINALMNLMDKIRLGSFMWNLKNRSDMYKDMDFPFADFPCTPVWNKLARTDSVLWVLRCSDPNPIVISSLDIIHPLIHISLPYISFLYTQGVALVFLSGYPCCYRLIPGFTSLPLQHNSTKGIIIIGDHSLRASRSWPLHISLWTTILRPVFPTHCVLDDNMKPMAAHTATPEPVLDRNLYTIPDKRAPAHPIDVPMLIPYTPGYLTSPQMDCAMSRLVSQVFSFAAETAPLQYPAPRCVDTRNALKTLGQQLHVDAARCTPKQIYLNELYRHNHAVTHKRPPNIDEFAQL